VLSRVLASCGGEKRSRSCEEDDEEGKEVEAQLFERLRVDLPVCALQVGIAVSMWFSTVTDLSYFVASR
jgi:hypothetical protein